MAEKARGCLKFGCIGCVAVVGLGVIATAVLGGLVALQANRETRMESLASEHRPSAGRPAAAPPAGTLPLEEGDPRLAEPGRIVLDVSMCNFEIEPGPPGEPLRLEGNYDAASLEVEEDWSSHGEVGWTYHLSLGQRGLPSWFQAAEAGCEVRLVVPRQSPFTLEGEIGIGESRLELGGLYVLGVDLSTGAGEHEVSFGEPVPRPLDHLRVRGSMGEFAVVGIGHASPAEVEIRHSMGEARVDLGGDWRNDSEVVVSCGMGACRLEVPRDVGIELGRTSLSFGESNFDVLEGREALAGRPTLKLSLSQTMGEFRIDD